MKKVSIVTAAVVAAVIFFLLLTLPPLPVGVAWTGDPELPRRTVAGAYHIHSAQSDGAADRGSIAVAAARAGLQFIILTDHGDGTRPPAGPVYIQGVLCVEGVEISTAGGHYVALGMPVAPYPLGGEPSAVVEDVARFGGFGIAAHVDSPKAELAWTDWDAPVDGVEWLNADSEWRNERRIRLARVLFDYLLRPGPAMASMLDRPSNTLTRWDALTETRPVVGIAGHDAHGGIGTRTEDGRRSGIPGVPSYEASFRSFSVRAILDAPLSGDAAPDGRRLLDAVRRGRLFTVIDAVATPAILDFQGWQKSGLVSRVPMGGTLRAGEGDLAVKVSMPPSGRLVLMHEGREVGTTAGTEYRTTVHEAAGAFRVEVTIPGAPGHPPVPWLVSNPIYFLPPTSPPAAPVAHSVVPFPRGLRWRIEKDPGSSGSVTGTDSVIMLEFRLKPGTRGSQFVAVAADLEGRLGQAGAVTFDARASRPMRVSVQVRYPLGGGERWARSFFVDTERTHVTVRVEDMMPADRQTERAPAVTTAGSLLFVVDLTNASPGDSGALEISNLATGREP